MHIDNNRSGFLWEYVKCTKAYRNEESHEEKILGNDYAGSYNQHSVLCRHYGAGKHRAGGAGGDCLACVGSYNVKRERLLSRCFSLDITCEGAEKIFYTMDGSNPMTSGTRKEYTGAVSVTDRKNDLNVLAAVEPVLFDCAYSTYNGSSCKAPADNEVDKATVIKAVGIDASGNYSGVVTNTYFVGSMAGHIQGIEESCKAAGIPLAIMSVSMDYNDLFDYEKGIYVRGKVFEDAYRDWMDGKNPEAKEMRIWRQIIHRGGLNGKGLHILITWRAMGRRLPVNCSRIVELGYREIIPAQIYKKGFGFMQRRNMVRRILIIRFLGKI